MQSKDFLPFWPTEHETDSPYPKMYIYINGYSEHYLIFQSMWKDLRISKRSLQSIINDVNEYECIYQKTYSIKIHKNWCINTESVYLLSI